MKKEKSNRMNSGAKTENIFKTREITNFDAENISKNNRFALPNFEFSRENRKSMTKMTILTKMTEKMGRRNPLTPFEKEGICSFSLLFKEGQGVVLCKLRD